MEKGFFFNAFPDAQFATGYDRNYSADDISRWLKAVITDGVIKTDSVAGTGEPLGLKVLADSGMTIKVNVGLAVIEGKPYSNDSALSLTLATAPTSGVRYDCVVLRMDNRQLADARKTHCIVESLDHIPTESDLARSGGIYDLLLGYVSVQANATAISQTDITDKRGDATLCPWCVTCKGYEDYYDAIVQRFTSNVSLATSDTDVLTDIPVSLYNSKYSLISVFTNGLKEESGDYSVVLTGTYVKIVFSATKNAGANVSVIMDNLIDGEGLESVLEQYNELVQEVEGMSAINEFNYYCNESTDNVALSSLLNQIASQNRNAKINVIGTFGITAPYSGDGSSGSPYRIIDVGSGSGKITIDFSNCSLIDYVPTSGKSTILIGGAGGRVVGLRARLVNTANNTQIVAFSLGAWNVERCEVRIDGYYSSHIAENGVFIDCKTYVYNANGSSYNFLCANGCFLSVRGGEHTAHASTMSDISAVVYQTQANSATILDAVNMPTISISGRYQKYSIYQNDGDLSSFGLVTTIAISTTNAQMYGTINANFTNRIW